MCVCVFFPLTNVRSEKAVLTVMSPARDDMDGAPRAPMTPEEEETEQRYLSYLQRAQSMDLSEFDRLNAVYHSGRYGFCLVDLLTDC